MICTWLRRHRKRPEPTQEAVKHRDELASLAPRVERVVEERRRLLAENNYTARIRALYEGNTN